MSATAAASCSTFTVWRVKKLVAAAGGALQIRASMKAVNIHHTRNGITRRTVMSRVTTNTKVKVVEPLVIPPVAPASVEIPPPLPEELRILQDCIAWFADGKHWTRGQFKDHYTGATCALGALDKFSGIRHYSWDTAVRGGLSSKEKARYLLQSAIPSNKKRCYSITSYNDSLRSPKTIVKWFRRAFELGLRSNQEE